VIPATNTSTATPAWIIPIASGAEVIPLAKPRVKPPNVACPHTPASMFAIVSQHATLAIRPEVVVGAQVHLEANV